ncbi:MAG: hypothetical protein SFU25_05570 [Candidatus Caenarcaniphilales bacterium]|nr:hypothetical protein [Candidatus Caenarcaniphilales bacterium]
MSNLNNYSNQRSQRVNIFANEEIKGGVNVCKFESEPITAEPFSKVNKPSIDELTHTIKKDKPKEQTQEEIKIDESSLLPQLKPSRAHINDLTYTISKTNDLYSKKPFEPECILEKTIKLEQAPAPLFDESLIITAKKKTLKKKKTGFWKVFAGFFFLINLFTLNNQARIANLIQEQKSILETSSKRLDYTINDPFHASKNQENNALNKQTKALKARSAEISKKGNKDKLVAKLDAKSQNKLKEENFQFKALIGASNQTFQNTISSNSADIKDFREVLKEDLKKNSINKFSPIKIEENHSINSYPILSSQSN